MLEKYLTSNNLNINGKLKTKQNSLLGFIGNMARTKGRGGILNKMGNELTLRKRPDKQCSNRNCKESNDQSQTI